MVVCQLSDAMELVPGAVGGCVDVRGRAAGRSV